MKRRLLVIALCAWLGVGTATAAPAGLPAPIAQEVKALPAARLEQRQALSDELQSALRLGLSEHEIGRVLYLAAHNHYTAGDVARFVRTLVAVHRQGLPTRRVRDKILEGMAKGVSAQAILNVASAWASALRDNQATVQALERQGLLYTHAVEREQLIDEGAVLQQWYGARQTLSTLFVTLKASGPVGQDSAATLLAASRLTELLLLNGAKVEQALALPRAALSAGYDAQRLRALSRQVAAELHRGASVQDILRDQQQRLATPPARAPQHPAFEAPGQSPGGSPAYPGNPAEGSPAGGPPGSPGGMPGGGPGGPAGGGFPGGGGGGGGHYGPGPGGGFPGGSGPGG